IGITLERKRRFLPQPKGMRVPAPRVRSMVTYDGHNQEQTRLECFLCSLDPQPCTIPKIEGHIIYAHEARLDGEITPFITLAIGNDYASFSLTHHYRSLVKGLIDLGNDLRAKKFTLRVFHLPPATNTTDRNA